MGFNIEEIQDALLQSKTLKVAVPTVLLAPIAMPFVHALAGLAVAGLTVAAAGSLIGKASGALSDMIPLAEKQDDAEDY
ncbi:MULTISPECIES: hypothetical protein [Chlorobium]|uniref:Uncharacterized protein n=1 Tax=Chlorobium ferrooxidans DSM 13031 TaxID=377431 RepID=Q0YRA2_9CHLB|nr:MULTISPECIES: hypothetical protein [Chlorobium]EAT58810.1 hypothetical protein CferDRAFT_0784 [Chlorobium ferrooxidans DSM 13031]